MSNDACARYPKYTQRLLIAACAIAALFTTIPIYPHARAEEPPASPAQSKTRNILEEDPKLSKKITVDFERDSTINRVLRAMTSETSTRIKLGDEIDGLKNELIRVRFNDIPLRDAMDAIAALHGLQWERVEKDMYVLRGRKNFNDVFLPQGPFQVERAAIGMQFLKNFEQLPPEQQQALTNPDKHLSFSQMSQPMQRQIQAMLGSLIREMAEQKVTAAFKLDDDLADTTVNFQVTEKAGFTNFMVSVSDDAGAMAWSFNDLPERRRAEATASATLPTYNTKDFAATPEDTFHRPSKGNAPEETPPSPIKISIEEPAPTPVSQTATELIHSVQELKGNGSYALDPDTVQAPSVMVTLKDIPLTEALTKMRTFYPDTEWEFRRSGILVVRGPHNGANKPK